MNEPGLAGASRLAYEGFCSHTMLLRGIRIELWIVSIVFSVKETILQPALSRTGSAAFSSRFSFAGDRTQQWKWSFSASARV